MSSRANLKPGVLLLEVVSLLPAGVILWILSQPRNLHMMAWNPSYRYGFYVLILVALFCFITITFSLGRMGKKVKQARSGLGILATISLVLSALLPIGFYLYLTPCAPSADKPPHVILTDWPGNDGLPIPAITWYTSSPGAFTVRYGTDPEKLEYEVLESEPVKSHLLPLEHMQAGEKWYWNIEGSQSIHELPWFPDREKDSIHLAVSSDSHIGAGTNNPEATERILTTIAEEDYDLFFHLGDLVEMGNEDSEYTQYLELSSPYLTSIPSVHLLGNHDGWFSGIHYFQKFFQPEAMEPHSSDSRLYHRYDIGDDLHIITLNLEWGTETYSTRQQRWLESVLADIPPEQMIIIMNHGFYYASSTEYEGIPWYDNQQMIETFSDLYQKSGVDLVLSGHDHQMEHITVDGIDYVIIGALGGKPDREPTYISPGSQFFSLGVFGYLDIRITQDTYRVSFIDETGEELYTFSRGRQE